MELQKAWEEVSDLQEKVTSAQSKISFTIADDGGYSEKLALKHEVRMLRDNLESRDKDVKKLRAEFRVSWTIIMIFGVFMKHCLRRCRCCALRL